MLYSMYLFSRHFSKSKIRRDAEAPWGPGVQAVPASHGPAQSQPPSGHPHNPTIRSTRTLVRRTGGNDMMRKCKEINVYYVQFYVG